MILDNEVPHQRRIVVKPVDGSYNSYSIDEKQKRDWSGNIYLACVVGILAIAFFI
ncbi:hypothetical protein [Priestia megaterium]|uniref:hypothetical protein n=1 Tax=Priestia megaterium TaxID=1404 RepID=UPI0018672BD4|nr:hypothetical protein [Priestia megaterium]MBE2977758.1 hypothetical protein [Priestia megaterium]